MKLPQNVIKVLQQFIVLHIFGHLKPLFLFINTKFICYMMLLPRSNVTWKRKCIFGQDRASRESRGASEIPGLLALQASDP